MPETRNMKGVNNGMKRMALFVIAALVFSVYAPQAQAQPFADVPTDIFAFDAVAELAAKGIIEGYPDGTFKGDRAMTRYEMAMVVARLLARIEAIKIPPAPPAPKGGPVTRADVDRLQRLLNEFRAELAAQGVRVTAVEEELAAIRAKLSNVRITGDLRFRYTVSGTLPTPLGPDGRVTNTADSTTSTVYRTRLTFTGQAASNVRAVAQVTLGAPPGSSQFGFNTAGQVNATTYGTVGFGNAYVDFDPLFGMAWRLGRQVYTLAPVGLSNYGLLFDPGDSGFGYADGLRVKGTFSGWNWELGAWAGGAAAAGTYNLANLPAANAQFVNTFFTGSLTLPLLPGWNLRVSALSQQRNFNSGGINPNTSDFGWTVDASGNLIPGVGFGAAYANFSGYLPAAPAGQTQSSNAWTAWLNFDLGALSGMTTLSPKLGFQYKSYGPNTGDYNLGTATMPAVNGAITETYGLNYWNFQGWAATLGLKFTPDLKGTFTYETGNTLVNGTGYGSGAAVVPSGSQVTEWYATFDYSLAQATTLSARYFRRTVANSDSSNFYRIQLTYSF